MEVRTSNLYGAMPLGARRYRSATVAEVVLFETRWAREPFSAVNCAVPTGVPIWQYPDPEDAAKALRIMLSRR
jgi:hypothetical protein